MRNPTSDAVGRQIIEQLAQASPPTWVLAMIEHYRRTGSYRPRDLRRLLGDSRESVKGSSEKSIEAALTAMARPT